MVMEIADYFDLSHVTFADIFPPNQPLWAALAPKYKETWILEHIQPNADLIETQDGLVTTHQVFENYEGTWYKCLTRKLTENCFEIFPGAFLQDKNIEIQKGCRIESGAYLAGPTILGEGTVVRHGAYVRGGVLTGHNCVIGHTTEVKSSIFLNEAKAAHFAYVGDSILGNEVNLGAGTKISNLKITNTEIAVVHEKKTIKTGLRKFGGILGDHVQTGCNAVINPGSMLQKKCMVYPNTSVTAQIHPTKTIIR